MLNWNPANRPTYYRILEIITALLSWGTLILCVILSFIVPLWIAVFVVCFDLYWLMRVTYLNYHLIEGYRQMRQNTKINWLERVKLIRGRNWVDYYHLVIFPVVREVAVMESTFKALSQANYPLDKFIVVLACEDKFWSETGPVAAIIAAKYGPRFRHFELTHDKPPFI